MNTLRDSRAFKIIPDENLERHHYTVTENFLSDDECDEILEYGNKQNLFWGTVYSDPEDVRDVKPDHRVVKTAGIPDDIFGWLYDRMAGEVLQINERFYDYDIRGLYEDILFLKYTEFEEYGPGKFDWHRDISGTGITNRKITTIVQLSNEDEYEGCDLQFWHDNIIECTAKQKGTLISFPSWVSHRVTPITRGSRHSLVTWVTGPPFR